MEQMRKRIMRCTHPTPCEICLTDCKRAEITAKEGEIRADLLDVCKDLLFLVGPQNTIGLSPKLIIKANAALLKACPNG